MSRVTAPIAKQLARSTANAARPSSSLLDHNPGAVLIPKYAELLRNRRSNEHTDSSRGLTTTHRPTPQPSIANRTKPLMQTFHSSPASSAPSTHLDTTVLPSFESLYSSSSLSSAAQPRVPILPDNYSGHNTETADAPVDRPHVTIVAADPSKVMPGTPLSEVDTVGLDGVELKFAHQTPAPAGADSDAHEGGMLRDLWKGMVEDVKEVLGEPAKKAT